MLIIFLLIKRSATYKQLFLIQLQKFIDNYKNPKMGKGRFEMV